MLSIHYFLIKRKKLFGQPHTQIFLEFCYHLFKQSNKYLAYNEGI